MKKKFKRLVKTKTAAKNKGCRIMSAFLAAAVFVSGGVFGTLAKSGFTVAEDDEYVSAQEDIYDGSFGEIPFESDVDILAAAGNSGSVLMLKPNEDVLEKVEVRNWEKNTDFSENDPYILRTGNSVTLCGTIEDAVVLNHDPATCNDPNHTKITTTYCRVSLMNYNTGILTVWWIDSCGHDTNECTHSEKVTKQYCINKTGNFWFSDQTNTNISHGNISHAATLDVDGNLTSEVRAYTTFTADKSITASNMFNGTITFDNGVPFNQIPQGINPDSIWKKFNISVRPTFINVYTEVAERDMDKVNEYVNGANRLQSELRKVQGDAQTSAYFPNTQNTPYMLLDGQSVKIKGLGTSNINSATVKNLGGYDSHGTYHDEQTCDSSPDGEYVVYTVHGDVGLFCAEYHTGYQIDGKDVIEKFYFRIYDKTANTQTYDHADIEIADNGIYTMTREVFERDDNGDYVLDINGNPIKYKLVTKYEAFVSDINKSEMYDKNEEIILLNLPGGGGTTDHIPAEDYWKDPTKKPGDQQFELTSKYKRNVTKDPVTGEITGDYSIDIPSITDNLTFDMYAVHDVKFYVDLLLRPKTMQKCDMDGNPLEPAVDITDHPEQTIHNVVFDMDYQSVQDAYNKCPDHSGLDFTVRDNLNEVISTALNYADLDLEAKKAYENGALNSGDFQFELWYVPRDIDDFNPDDPRTYEIVNGNKKAIARLIDTVSNGEYDVNNGTAPIIFKDIPFFEPVVSYGDGENNFVYEYHYQIKESIPDDKEPNITYDERTIDVYVTLTKDKVTDEFMQDIIYKRDGEVVDPTFTNKYTPDTKYYTLPSTGGPGVNMYIISGAGLMLIAAAMYRRKRKGGAIL